MARVARGEAAAFRMLLGAARRPCVRGRLPHGAEPCRRRGHVQDAFVRVWTNAGPGGLTGPRFSTWLHRVVLNLCLDLHRRRRTGGTTISRSAAEVPDRSPEMKIEAGQRTRRAAEDARNRRAALAGPPADGACPYLCRRAQQRRGSRRSWTYCTSARSIAPRQSPQGCGAVVGAARTEGWRRWTRRLVGGASPTGTRPGRGVVGLQRRLASVPAERPQRARSLADLIEPARDWRSPRTSPRSRFSLLLGIWIGSERAMDPGASMPALRDRGHVSGCYAGLGDGL